MLADQIRRFFGLEDEIDDRGERRLDPRRRTSLGVEVFPVTEFADLLIETVSVTGIVGQAEVPLRPGQPLLFSAGKPAFHAGIVRWVKGRRFGLKLPDAPATLGFELKTDKHGRRRGTVRQSGRIAIAPASFRARLCDVSQNGLRLESDVAAERGQALLVRMPDRGLVPTSVEWAEGRKLGLKTEDRIAILRLIYAYE